MKSTPPMKIHIVVNDERKTPKSPTIAFGCLSREQG